MVCDRGDVSRYLTVARWCCLFCYWLFIAGFCFTTEREAEEETEQEPDCQRLKTEISTAFMDACQHHMETSGPQNEVYTEVPESAVALRATCGSKGKSKNSVCILYEYSNSVNIAVILQTDL